MRPRLRNGLALLLMAVATVLLLWGARRTVVVYAAQPADSATQTDGAQEPDSLQAVTGVGGARWKADKSKQEKLNALDMVEKATIGGVARTEGDLHLTGEEACPT